MAFYKNFNELKIGRHYIFEPRNKAIAIEDINIAAALLCHGYDSLTSVEYAPGKFNGTEFGRHTKTGEMIFIFIIDGDPIKLNQVRLLFHAGAYRVDPQDFVNRRNMLLDALTNAKREARKKMGDKKDDDQRTD